MLRQETEKHERAIASRKAEDDNDHVVLLATGLLSEGEDEVHARIEEWGRGTGYGREAGPQWLARACELRDSGADREAYYVFQIAAQVMIGTESARQAWDEIRKLDARMMRISQLESLALSSDPRSVGEGFYELARMTRDRNRSGRLFKQAALKGAGKWASDAMVELCLRVQWQTDDEIEIAEALLKRVAQRGVLTDEAFQFCLEVLAGDDDFDDDEDDDEHPW